MVSIQDYACAHLIICKDFNILKARNYMTLNFESNEKQGCT